MDYELNRMMHFTELSMAVQESPGGKNCFPQCEIEDWMDSMVGYDNDSWSVQWFHYSCDGLIKVTVTKGRWLCPLCCSSDTMGLDVK